MDRRGGVRMILSFLLGAGTFAALAYLEPRFAVFVFGFALLIVWIEETAKHQQLMHDRLTALRRWREWGMGE
jgi:hypothetical protein